MKIVINSCIGKFAISKKAAQLMASKGNKQAQNQLDENTDMPCIVRNPEQFDYKYDRTDPILIETIETLKEEANGTLAKLKIIEIPDDLKYYLEDTHGYETIHETHRIWE